MDYQTLLQSGRWEIIKAISKGRASATELARLTKSSLPNVSQQVKLLEAYDLIEYVKEQRSKLGKPRQLYGLKHDVCHIAFARHGFAEKRFFNPDAYHALLLNVLFIPSMQDHAYLHKFLLNDELLRCSVAFVKSSEHEIELFIITEDVELVRSKYSNSFVEHNGKMRKIITWTHTLHEVQEGMRKKDQYFLNLLKHHVLNDPRNDFTKL
jgi:hypothetical protein